MVTTVKPKASETPTRPIPTSGNLAASTALPQPPKTSQKVPNNSATARLAMGMVVLPTVCCCWRGNVAWSVAGAHWPVGLTYGDQRVAHSRSRLVATVFECFGAVGSRDQQPEDQCDRHDRMDPVVQAAPRAH